MDPPGTGPLAATVQLVDAGDAGDGAGLSSPSPAACVSNDLVTPEPAELTVKVGTTVTWTNRDDIPHTVVAAGKFRSKTLDTDDKFSFTFTNAGDYKYFCSLHPHMTGMIKVE